MHEQPVGDRLDVGQWRVLAELGTALDGEVEQRGHGKVGIEVTGAGVEADLAVERDARPALGDRSRGEQGGLDTLGTHGGVHLLLAAGAGVETTGLRAEADPGLVLEPIPLVGGASGEGDVDGVGVGPSVDAGGPVRAAPLVSDGELLEEEHGVATGGELAGRGRAGEPGADDSDVVVMRHRCLRGSGAPPGRGARRCSAR